MNRHTPAPWEVIYTPKGYVSRIRSSDAARAKKPGACYDITRHNGFAMPASEEGKANARLISSAPDLLEALDAAYVHLARVDNQWEERHTLKGQALLCKMRDAIAKASGKTEQDVRDAVTAKAKGEA